MSFPVRLHQAQAAGLHLPERGVAVFGATPDMDLSDLTDPIIVSRDARVHARWPHATTTAPAQTTAAVVLIAREKARARADLADAAASTQGSLVVDGQKTDGIEPVLKTFKSQGTIVGSVSKAHGKLFWCDALPDLSDWRAAPLEVDGLRSWPGVFSATKVDAGSQLLAQALPANLGTAVCDLGAGWGWLSAQIVSRCQSLHMVEADDWALECARHNVPQATAHWADVTQWISPQLFDAVVMNPPFHEGRRGVPDLGIAFIAKAAEILRPTGALYMVANRHLPYEAALSAHFDKVTEMNGDGRFKLFCAQKPTARRRSKTPARLRPRARG